MIWINRAAAFGSSGVSDGPSKAPFAEQIHANLISLLPSLMLKDEFSRFDTGLDPDDLHHLTRVSRLLDELLNRAPNRGFRVRLFTIDEVADAIEIRGELEALAAADAPAS